MAESAVPSAEGGSPTLKSIQVLRAVAAIGVLTLHAATEKVTFLGGEPGPFKNFLLGAAGVDLFFVISGFVMVYSSQSLFGRAGGPRKFLLRRIARIGPLYWAVTAAIIAYIYAVHGAKLWEIYSPASLVASFLFWPYPRMDGFAFPVHLLGWTLNYEMFFYLLFGFCLFVPWPRARFALLAAIFLLLVAAGQIFQPGGPVLRTYTDPIMLEFLAGAVLAIVSPYLMRCGTLAGFTLLAVAVLWVTEVYLQGFALDRIVSHGIPAIVAVIGALMIEPWARARPSRIGLMLGDASYSIYLAHPFAQRLWLLAVNRTFGLAAVSPTFYVLAAFAIGIVGGVICHFAIERPLLIAGRRLIGRSQPTR